MNDDEMEACLILIIIAAMFIGIGYWWGNSKEEVPPEPRTVVIPDMTPPKIDLWEEVPDEYKHPVPPMRAPKDAKTCGVYGEDTKYSNQCIVCPDLFDGCLYITHDPDDYWNLIYKY